MPHRTSWLRCPRCRDVGIEGATLARCRKCNGTWVSEEVVAERVARMQDARPMLAWSHDIRAVLPCASCSASMQPLLLFGVAVDRCPSHGVWFDVEELAQVLLRSVRARPSPGPDGNQVVGAIDAVDTGGTAITVIDVVLEVVAGLITAVIDA